MPTSPKQKREIYWWLHNIYKRITMFSQELTQFGLNHRNEPIPHLWGEKTPIQLKVRSKICSNPTNQSTASSIWSIDRSTAQTAGVMEMSIHRPNWIFPLCQYRSTGRSTDSLGVSSLWMLVDQSSDIEFINSIFLVFDSLYNHHTWTRDRNLTTWSVLPC